MGFPTVSNRVFSADVGQPSTGNAGPDAIEQDIDNRRTEIQGIINALQSTTDGDSGADNVKVTPIGGAAGGSVQAVLETLKTQIDQIANADIPDGSITLAKFAPDAINKVNNIDVSFRNIIKLLMKNSGVNAGVNAWADYIDDTTGLDLAKCTGWYFDSVNKSLKSNNGINLARYTGTAISGGDYSGLDAVRAFDGSTTTGWASYQTGSNVAYNAYIGKDFGPNVKRHIRTIKIFSPGGNNFVLNVKIQRSNDGSTWVDVGSYYMLTEGVWSTLNLPESDFSRYWRVLAISDPASGYPWAVSEVEMYEAASSAVIYWLPQTTDGTVNKGIVEAVQNLGTGSITYEVSRNGGVTFTNCPLDTVTDISSQPTGTSFVLKATITGNAEVLAVGYGGEL